MAQLLVRGYKGKSLADQLPAWQSFDVAAYGDYMRAISKIQTQIEEDEDNIVPELIWTTVNADGVPPVSAAVGTVYAYHAISEGRPLLDALRRLTVHELPVADAIRAVYETLIGRDEQAIPAMQLRDEAKRQLCGLHL